MLYRNRSKGFGSIYELSSIDGLSPTEIEMILPFVTVEPYTENRKTTINQIAKYGRHELILRHTRIFPESEGYAPISDSELVENPNARYLGSPDRIYARYRFQFGQKVSIGITGEKDPGEEFFKGTQSQGFDFYSAHLFLRDFGPVKRLAIGDYNLQVGQGLVAWTGYAFRKSPSNTVEIKRYAQGIRAYTSADENNYLRGGAAIVNWKKLDFTAFYSSKKVDGNLNRYVDTLTNDEILSTSSIQQSGFHRTPAELEDKNSVHENVFGGALDFNFSKGKIGVISLFSKYDPPLIKDAQLYQIHQFQGDESGNIGVHYQLNINKFGFFGESAMSDNGGLATINGVNMNLDQRFKMAVVQRYYQPEYHNLYGDAFGEKSGTNNENGIYIGAEFYPIKKVAVSAYYDQYQFPWLSYQLDAPSNGNDFSGQLTIKPNRDLEFLILYRREMRDANVSDENSPIRYTQKETNDRYRFQVSSKVNSWISLRTRAELKNYQEGNDPIKIGYVLYQDIYFDLLENKLTLKLRYALIQTEDYDSRIYAYEHDLRYQFTVPAYYSTGSRTYLVVRYQLLKNLTVNMKWAQSFNAIEDEFGSGKDLIESNTKTELKSQLIFRF